LFFLSNIYKLCVLKYSEIEIDHDDVKSDEDNNKKVSSRDKFIQKQFFFVVGF
jgi:hypothetical protein